METAVVEKSVRVGSSHGLHARPAKLFAQAAAGSGTRVTISKAGGKAVNAASILAVVALRIEHGDEVTLSAEGDGAEGVLDQLADILTTDHDA